MLRALLLVLLAGLPLASAAAQRPGDAGGAAPADAGFVDAAPPSLCEVIRAAGSLALPQADLRRVPPQPRGTDALAASGPLAPAAASPAAAARLPQGAGPHCQRLPYRATAPPARA